jgi:hypothetical protein
MTNTLNLIAGKPLMILPERIAAFAEVLAGAASLSPDMSRFAGSTRQGQPYRATENGVDVLSIVGPLANRGMLVGENWGLNTYEGLQFKL